MYENWTEGTEVFNDLVEEILFLRNPENSAVLMDDDLRIQLIVGVINNLAFAGWDYTDSAVQEMLAFKDDPLVEAAFVAYEKEFK